MLPAPSPFSIVTCVRSARALRLLVVPCFLALGPGITAQDSPPPSVPDSPPQSSTSETSPTPIDPAQAAPNPEPAPETAPQAAPQPGSSTNAPAPEPEPGVEPDGRGVFLPFDQFLQLRKQLAEASLESEPAPPVPAMVHRATHRGRLLDSAKGPLEIRSSIEAESFRKGWSQVSLSGTQLSVSAAATGKATLLSDESGYQLLLPEKGLYEVDLTILEPVQPGEDENEFTTTLHLPNAPVSKVELELPGTGLDIQLSDGIAFSTSEVDGNTRIDFFAGQRESVDLAWRPVSPRENATPLILAESRLTSTLIQGGTRTVVDFELQVLRSPVEELELRIPQDHELLLVKGDSLYEWSVSNRDQHRLLLVHFREPRLGDSTLQLTFEQVFESLPVRLSVPEVLIPSADRQSGHLILRQGDGIDVEIQSSRGLSRQANFDSPPEGLRPLAAFRYLATPYSLQLTMSAARPEVSVSSLSMLHAAPDELRLETTLDLAVTEAPLSTLEIHYPAGWTGVEAEGPGIAESRFLDGVFELRFREPLRGDASFSLTATSEDPPPRDSAPLPSLQIPQARSHNAVLEVVLAPEMTAAITDPGAFRALPGEALAFRFRQEDKPAALRIEEKPPIVSALTLASVSIDDASLEYRWRVHYDVVQGSVREVALSIPESLTGRLTLDDPSLVHRTIALGEEDEPSTGRARWIIQLPERKASPFSVSFSLSEPLAQPAPEATSVPVEIPVIEPLDVAGRSGQIAIRHASDLHLDFPETANLVAISPSQLDPALQKPAAAHAFAFRNTLPSLRLTVARNILVEVPDLHVLYADVTHVMSGDGSITADMIYWVRSRDQATLKILLPKDSAITTGILVGDTVQRPMRSRRDGELVVTLPERDPAAADTAYPVRFFYEVSSKFLGKTLPRRGDLTIPVPSLLNASIQQSRATVYLPLTYRFTQFDSSMELQEALSGWRQLRQGLDFIIPALGPQIRAVPVVEWNDPPTLSPSQADAFAVPLIREGQRYTFQRLGPPSSIATAYLSQNIASLIEAGICFFALAFGMLLTRKSLEQKFLYLVFVAFLPLVAAGVVAPHLAEMYRIVFLGALLAVVFWLLMGIWWLIKPHPVPAQPVFGVPAASPPHYRNDFEEDEGIDPQPGIGVGIEEEEDEKAAAATAATVAASPSPSPETKPGAKPESEAMTEKEGDAAPKSETTFEPGPESQPEAEPNPKPEAKAEPQSEAASEPQSEVTSESGPVTGPEPKRDPSQESVKTGPSSS